MKTFFITTWVTLSLLSVPTLAATREVSDSLVNRLRCDTLSVGSILGSIRPDAFSSRNHMPIQNWGFRSGAFNLGACWGMGSTQRKLFYLLRTGNKAATSFDMVSTFDMIRGASLNSALELKASTERRVQETALTSYKVIPLREENIRDEFGRNSSDGFINSLLAGIDYKVDRMQITRTLRSEVERSQERHFFRPKNIGMGVGAGPQDPETNRASVKTLIANAKLNRLTLVNLRLRQTIQHIVIVKSYTQEANGNVTFKVYDSNQYDQDQDLYFDKSTGHFYAPQILRISQKDAFVIEANQALGVFIVDEQERTDIEKSLLAYYKKVCGSL